MSVIEFDPPERFVVGTVGPPGQRTFFIQASDDRRRSQVSVEKMHVGVLAERLETLLDEVGGHEGGVSAAVTSTGVGAGSSTPPIHSWTDPGPSGPSRSTVTGTQVHPPVRATR